MTNDTERNLSSGEKIDPNDKRMANDPHSTNYSPTKDDSRAKDDSRKEALGLVEKIDDALRRLGGFHDANDLGSARVAGGQLADLYARLKALIV